MYAIDFAGLHRQGGTFAHYDGLIIVPGMAPALPPAAPQPQLKTSLSDLPQSRIVLLSAPTGYGKTVLANHWFEQWQPRKAWIRCRSGDAFLSAMLEQLTQQLGLNLPALPSMPESTQIQRLLDAVATLPAEIPTLCVFDDLQLLSTKLQTELLKPLLSMESIRFVLSARDPQPALLTPYRINQQLIQIEAEQLALDLDQISNLLDGLPEPMDASQIAQLNQDLRGWPAMWQLVYSLLQQGYPTAQLGLSELSADTADYLVAEIIDPQPDTFKALLFALVVFDEFDLTLLQQACPGQHRAAQLSAMLRMALPIVREPARPQFLRFVPLFRSAMRHYLALHDAERLEIAAHRGFDALMNLERWQAAAELALEQTSRVLAQRWLEQVGWQAYHRSHYALLQQLFSLLPTSLLRTLPDLAILYGWLLLEGFKQSPETSSWVESLDLDSWPAVDRARMHALEAELNYKFDLLERTLNHAQQALAQPTPNHARLSASFSRAMALLWLGHLSEAEQALKALAPEALGLKHFHIGLSATVRLANCQQLQLQLQPAVTQLEQARSLIEALQLQADPEFDTVVRTEIELRLMQGELKLAQARLDEGKQLPKPLGDYWLFSYQSLELTVQLLTGQPVTALQQTLEQRLQQDLYCRQWRYRAHTALAVSYHWQNNQPALAELSKQLHWHKQPQGLHQIQENLLYSRVARYRGLAVPPTLIQQSEQWQQAGCTLFAQQALWLATPLEAVPSAAIRKLIAAWLDRGYLLELLLAGADALPLWQTLKRRWKDSARRTQTLGQLIAHLTAQQQALHGNRPPPDERLTKKEWQVLQAIGAGFSNEQIAAQMHVALSTVKSHVNHLYSKLDLSDRNEARAVANALLRQAEISDE